MKKKSSKKKGADAESADFAPWTDVSSEKPRLRLGVYGGTFDPIHHGHVLLARDALEKMHLDAILFVPCAQSPHKARKPVATDEQRLEMLRLALKGESRFWLTRCELDRPPPSYAFDTALDILAAFPGTELFWMIGADQLAKLDQWHRPDDLRCLVNFLLLPRGEPVEVKTNRKVLSLPQGRRVDISATEIRHRVKSRQPITYLVPAPVATYIKRHKLYLS